MVSEPQPLFFPHGRGYMHFVLMHRLCTRIDIGVDKIKQVVSQLPLRTHVVSHNRHILFHWDLHRLHGCSCVTWPCLVAVPLLILALRMSLRFAWKTACTALSSTSPLLGAENTPWGFTVPDIRKLRNPGWKVILLWNVPQCQGWPHHSITQDPECTIVKEHSRRYSQRLELHVSRGKERQGARP